MKTTFLKIRKNRANLLTYKHKPVKIRRINPMTNSVCIDQSVPMKMRDGVVLVADI